MKKLIIFLFLVSLSVFLVCDEVAFEITEAVEAFEQKIALNPFGIDGDPYVNASFVPQHNKEDVCAIKYSEDKIHYTLASFKDEESAEANDYIVTHKTSCGTCSTLKDLSVYLKYRNLTAPVSNCGLKYRMKSRIMTCLEDLGFTHECAETWYYNVKNTRKECFWVCMKSRLSHESHTKEDGSLNDCLACDEEKSGPIFKKTSGRTRRNSGIISAIDRPEDEIYPLVHDYY